jgi:hypothetical protein
LREGHGRSLRIDFTKAAPSSAARRASPLPDRHRVGALLPNGAHSTEDLCIRASGLRLRDASRRADIFAERDVMEDLLDCRINPL